MRRIVLAALFLVACAPAPARQPVHTFEGSARVLLTVQTYRLTFTENRVTHEIRGTLVNRTSGDAFQATGTLLPATDGDLLTADISAGDSPRLNATVFGIGLRDVPLKAGALLSGTIRHDAFAGSLRVNGFSSALNMQRVQ